MTTAIQKVTTRTRWTITFDAYNYVAVNAYSWDYGIIDYESEEWVGEGRNPADFAGFFEK